MTPEFSSKVMRPDGTFKVGMIFHDLPAEIIDLLQYALMYGIEVDWVHGIGAFTVRNLDIRSEWDETRYPPVVVRRLVTVDGTLTP